MEKTTLYLTEDLRRALKDVAKRSGRSEAQLVREALAQYLMQQGRPSPRSIGSGSDTGVTARESEAWLRAHWEPVDHP